MDEFSSPPSTLPENRLHVLENVPAARLLALLAGAAAVVLGILMFIFQMASGPLEGPLGLYGRTPVIMMLIINAIFGAFLLVAYMGWREREKEWAVLVLAFALVLLVLGGIAGAVGGILGLVAAASVMARAWRRADAPATVRDA